MEPDLTLPGHPEIFVIGDLANYGHQTGKPLPGTAPVAIQQGQYVAKVIQSRVTGAPPPSFRYRDRGNMAIIGRASAVADLGKLQFSGFLAWLAWLFVHLMHLVEFENKVLVLNSVGLVLLSSQSRGAIDYQQRIRQAERLVHLASHVTILAAVSPVKRIEAFGMSNCKCHSERGAKNLLRSESMLRF